MEGLKRLVFDTGRVVEQGHSETGRPPQVTGIPRVLRSTPVKAFGAVAVAVAGLLLALPALSATGVSTPASSSPSSTHLATPARHVAPPATAAHRATPAASPAAGAARVAPAVSSDPVTRAHLASSRAVPPRPATAATVPSVALRLGANVAPVPDFLSAGAPTTVGGVTTFANPCLGTSFNWPTFSTASDCTQYVLAAIDHARALEGVKAMVLPSDWGTLTPAEQLFVVVDLERVDRGLAPYLGINAALSAAAQSSAARNQDPSLAPGFDLATNAQGQPAVAGAWGSGFSVLVADYVWMYDDGFAASGPSPNVECTSAGAAACWAHRAELLGTDPGFDSGVGLACANAEVGVGFATTASGASYSVLIEQPRAGQPAMSFTWARDVAPFL